MPSASFHLISFCRYLHFYQDSSCCLSPKYVFSRLPYLLSPPYLFLNLIFLATFSVFSYPISFSHSIFIRFLFPFFQYLSTILLFFSTFLLSHVPPLLPFRLLTSQSRLFLAIPSVSSYHISLLPLIYSKTFLISFSKYLSISFLFQPFSPLSLGTSSSFCLLTLRFLLIPATQFFQSFFFFHLPFL